MTKSDHKFNARDNDKSAERVCILILGMHRSGTSALTRTLNLSGAALPDNILQPASNNPTGFWEPKVIMRFNDTLLREFDSNWHDWRQIDVSKLSKLKTEEARNDLLKIICDEYNEDSLIIIKEPRICRIAPLYFSVIAEAGYNVCPVIMFRNPLEVCNSLASRNGFSTGKSALLWLRHVLDAEIASRRFRRAIVCYEDLLSDWRSVVESISVRLSLPEMIKKAEENGELLDDFLTPSHRHHEFNHEDLTTNPLFDHWIGKTYGALLALKQDDTSEQARSALDEVRAEFDKASLLFADAWAHQEQEVALERRKLSENFDRKVVEQVSVRMEHERSEFSAKLKKKDQQISVLTARQDALLKERDFLERQKNAFERLIGELAVYHHGSVNLNISFAREFAKYFNKPWLRRQHAKSAAKIVAKGGLLDSAWYISSNADLAQAGVKPEQHYLEYGAQEGRIPHPYLNSWSPKNSKAEFKMYVERSNLFDEDYYRSNFRAELTEADDALTFFIDVGIFRGHNPNAYFSPDFYLASNPAIIQSRHYSLIHYCETGWKNGRDPSQDFSVNWYLSEYRDVKAAGVEPLGHFLVYGREEGRKPCGPTQS